ncbi:hypothetical protein EDD22DRAFT_933754 [Suillus occidentalis]|nr:hypothetical protein EDD22DRAFT_933754 [Suillus occidentalis]
MTRTKLLFRCQLIATMPSLKSARSPLWPTGCSRSEDPHFQSRTQKSSRKCLRSYELRQLFGHSRLRRIRMLPIFDLRWQSNPVSY